MHTFLSTTHLTRVALKAARPARRHLMRALRHHSARTRALAGQVRQARPVDGMRAWFHSFFSVLRMRTGARHFSLRTLLYRPKTQLATLASPPPGHTRGKRQPRRMTSSSNGWFVFAFAVR